MTSRKNQCDASTVIRERIELVQDETMRECLHRQYNAFIFNLNANAQNRVIARNTIKEDENA